MPFTGFDNDDFGDLDRARCERLRSKLAELGSDIVAWAQGNADLRKLFVDHYVTQRSDYSVNWVAILRVPNVGEFQRLTMFPHAHFVFGEPSLLGVNIEFKDPRIITRDKLNPNFRADFNASFQAIRSAEGCYLVLSRKSVLNSDHRHYWWDQDLFYPPSQQFRAEEVTAEVLRLAYTHLTDPQPAHGDELKHYEPILLLTSFLTEDQLRVPGPEFVRTCRDTLQAVAPFLRVLS